jgi:hypothetical protein
MSNLELTREDHKFNFFHKDKKENNKLLKNALSCLISLLIGASLMSFGFYLNQLETRNTIYKQSMESHEGFSNKYTTIRNILYSMYEDEIYTVETKKQRHTKINVEVIKKEIDGYVNDLKKVKILEAEYLSYTILSGLMLSIKDGNYKNYISDKDYEYMVNKYKEFEPTSFNKITCPIWNNNCDLNEYKNTFNKSLEVIRSSNYISNLNKKYYAAFVKLPIEKRMNISNGLDSLKR